MIYDKDYLKRLVDGLARMLAAALNLRRAGKHEEAVEALHSSASELFGIEWAVLQFGGPAQAAALLERPERIKAFARLVEEEGEALRGAGRLEEASSSFARAAALYREALARGEDAEARAAVARLDALGSP